MLLNLVRILFSSLTVCQRSDQRRRNASMLVNGVSSLGHSLRRLIIISAAVSVTGSVLCAPALGATVEYAVTTLNGPANTESVVPWGINESGAVVGWIVLSGDPLTKAFLWTDGTGLTILPTPPGEDDYIARDISDTDIIAGGSEFGLAWIYQDGQYTILGTLPGTLTSEARGVNDFGDAAGTADPAALLSFQPFFYDATSEQMIQIAPTPGRGHDVNNAGQVAGHLGTTAFRWTVNGGLEELGPLDPTFSASFGFAINELGDVAGEAKDPTTNDRSRAFIFTDQMGMQMIPGIGLINRANGINDLGVVVGDTEKTGFGDKGWVWTGETGTRILDDLIDEARNISIITAHDVNDNGQIVGLGFDNNIGDFVAVRLTPYKLLADLDGDGIVGRSDLRLLLTSRGPCPDPPDACPADLDGDGRVGRSDVRILLQNWG